IIQTYAPVEVHCSYIENRVLHFLPRPRLDRLCFELHCTALPILVNKVHQDRAGIKDSAWHRNMVHEWKELDHKIEVEDGKDLKEAEEQSIDPEDENSP